MVACPGGQYYYPIYKGFYVLGGDAARVNHEWLLNYKDKLAQTFVYGPAVVGATVQVEYPVSTFRTHNNTWTDLVISNITDTCTPVANPITINPPANALPLDMATRTVRVANMAAHDFHTALALASPVPLLAPLLLPPPPPAPPASPAPGTAAALLILDSTW